MGTDDVLAAPRTILVVLTLLFFGTAMATFFYPPEYLAVPHLWATLAAVAAAMCLASFVVPGRRRVSVAGAAAVTAALTRSAAIGVQLMVGDLEGAQAWSFWLACLTWASIALMVRALWEHVVLPWAALMRQ